MTVKGSIIIFVLFAETANSTKFRYRGGTRASNTAVQRYTGLTYLASERTVPVAYYLIY